MNKTTENQSPTPDCGSLSVTHGSAPVAEHPDHLGYAYAEAEDADYWNGPHKTREEAIAEMLTHGWDDGWVSAVRAISEADEDVDEEWAFVCYGPREQIPQNTESSRR